MEPVQLAAILAGPVLVASMISVDVGISVALIELALGVLLGNILHSHRRRRPNTPTTISSRQTRRRHPHP
jgi:hypothetical protein